MWASCFIGEDLLLVIRLAVEVLTSAGLFAVRPTQTDIVIYQQLSLIASIRIISALFTSLDG